ncbi:MAG: amidohydrolase family protein [Rhodospirillales bacterium]|nr:amidohydrolase family protein [Rhodospirillales bacterium]
MSEAVLFTNANVLDVVQGAYLADRNVLVSDGKIIEISGAPIKFENARVINLRGKTLMPGLCDAHVHVTAFTADFAVLKTASPFYVSVRAGEILNGMIRRGFTTVRDAGGADWGLALAVKEGRIKGPRILFCGHALSQTGGHGDMRGPGEQGLHQCFCCAGLGHVCDGVADVLKAAREEIRRGVTHLKIMASGGVASPTDRIPSTQFSEDELKAITGEAEAALIPSMAHAYTARAVNRAIRCGISSIEHGNLIDQESVELFKEFGATLVPTLGIYKALVEEGEQAGMSADLISQTHEVLEAGMSALELAHRGGVHMAYGTDLLGQMHRRQLIEFQLRNDVVATADLIRQATVNAATLFRMDDRIGQVKTGFEADLIVIDGDPLRDINILCDPENNLPLIMKGGLILHENE